MSDYRVNRILEGIRRAGGRIWRDGNRLGLEPASRLPAELIAEVRQNKRLLLFHLDDEGGDKTQKAWKHVARQVLAREFDQGSRSLLKSIQIGLRSIEDTEARLALEMIEKLLAKPKHGNR